MWVPVRGLNSGIIARADLCWNFGRLVSETSRGYRVELKTPGCYLLGVHSDTFGAQNLPQKLVFEAALDDFTDHLWGPLRHPPNLFIRAITAQ